MALPFHLFLVRHSESDGNVAQAQSREKNDNSSFTHAFRTRHGSTYRLTSLGVNQAKAAGAWLKAAGFETFDEAMVSDFIRAIETAAHLRLPSVAWTFNETLRERDVGLMDQLPEDERQARFPEHIRQAACSPYFWTPPEGESIATVQIRLRAGFFRDLRHGKASRKTIAVCHGRVIQASRALIEGIPFWEYEKREREHDPDHVVHNAHIFQYSRVDPHDAEHVLPEFSWTRSICPWDEKKTNSAWRMLKKPVYSNEDLLTVAQQFSSLT